MIKHYVGGFIVGDSIVMLPFLIIGYIIIGIVKFISGSIFIVKCIIKGKDGDNNEE